MAQKFKIGDHIVAATPYALDLGWQGIVIKIIAIDEEDPDYFNGSYTLYYNSRRTSFNPINRKFNIGYINSDFRLATNTEKILYGI